MPTPKVANKIVSFYGGKVQIEVKPWGDHFRYIKVGTKGGTLSATGVTKHLDKSRALLPWAVGLVGSHIKSHFESAKSTAFSREEIFLVVDEALKKPEEAKVKGGDAGTLIHDYAHAFAKAHIAKTPLPDIKHLDPKNDVHAKAINGISAFLDWFNKRKSIRFIEMETLLYYNSFLAGDTKEGEEVIEFLGIEDLFAEVDGVYETVDYKTSKGVYSDQRYQVSCYFKARASNPDKNALKPRNTLILNFNKETGALIEKRIPAEEVEKDFKAFRGLHAVALREKELDEEYNQSKKNVSK